MKTYKTYTDETLRETVQHGSAFSCFVIRKALKISNNMRSKDREE
mgnify:CR=1 FL=1